ncbi:MAG: hypothetical protein Q7W16_07970 [Coriobacteriia bacterium]|nr:hypothetical protein [Coriobacteriia bacterium]
MARWTRTRSGSIALALCLALATITAAPGLAAAVAPTTTIATDPTSPESSGWYSIAPLVTLSSTQNGSLNWSWDGGEAVTVPAVAGVAQLIGPAPEGEHTLSAWSINAAAETETPVIRSIRVDSSAPSQPGSLDATVTLDVGVRLTWTASEDLVSGVRDYAVYRNTSGPPFSPSDLIGRTASTSYLDVPPAFAGEYSYAVSSWDVAGNESALSELVLGFSDFTPPSAPTGLRAWRSVGGGAGVDWAFAADVGIGVSRYDVLRSIDGGGFTAVGSIGRSENLFMDTDPALGSAITVDYRVMTVDRVGQVSPPAGPVRMRTSFTVTSSCGPGGSVSPYGTGTVLSDSDQTFSITPDEGYRVAGVLVDGVAVPATASYAFANVRADHTIHATFSLIPPASSGTPSTPFAPSSVRHGRSFTTFGYVIKHTSGTYPVTLQFYRYQSGHWVLRKSISARVSGVQSFSRYSRSTSVPTAGRWRVRARHKVGRRYRYSPYRYLSAR